MHVVGLFNTDDPYLPIMDINYLMEFNETPKCREILENAFFTPNASPIYIKFLAKVEMRFKNINLFLNMHFLPMNSNQDIKSLK